MNAVSASVVLYNTPDSQLKRLLDSIRRSSIEVHLYAVDNSPAPLCPPCLEVPGVSYLRADSNRGYGAGHNVALRKVLDSAEFHFVLNPDICFGPDELRTMVRFMRSDPAIGQLMPRIVYPDGSLQYLCKLLPTPADLFLRRFAVGPLKTLLKNRTERFEFRQSDYETVLDIPYLSGCFMLFRISALREVGLFDERFFMYPEDIDITRRMHACFRTVYYPEATVVHDHARESYKNLRALRIHTSNMIRYFNKWGWLFDAQRTLFNERALQQIQNPPLHENPSALESSLQGDRGILKG